VTGSAIPLRRSGGLIPFMFLLSGFLPLLTGPKGCRLGGGGDLPSPKPINSVERSFGIE